MNFKILKSALQLHQNQFYQSLDCKARKSANECQFVNELGWLDIGESVLMKEASL